MKKKLLLLAAVLLSWLGASAQWAKPEVKSLAPGDVANQGRLVRIYNVEYGAFLGGANAWGTQTSLLAEGLDYRLEWSNDGQNYKLLTSSGPKSGKYLFRDTESGCFIDLGNQNRGFNWAISQTENGFYTIQSPLDDSQYGTNMYWDAADMFFGWNGDGNIVYPNVRVEDYDAEGNLKPCGIEWAFVAKEDAAAFVESLKPYNAAMALKKIIDQAKADYPAIDCSKAEAVYNNTNSTVEELKAAEKLVANAIAALHTAEVLDGATEDNPVDGTELIVNADFSTGGINGWECTFVSGTTATNVGYQGAYYNGLDWEDEETGESGQAFFNQFIEAWANNVDGMKRDGKSFATIGDAKLCQTIYGMPAGKYKLAADVNAVQQWDKSQNPVTGVELYVLGGDIDSHVSMATGDGIPEHFILTFIHTGGDLELGLRTKNTTANWISADNFTLKYYGPILQNIDFSQGDVMDNGICTYQKDMASNGTVYYSQQEVPGWQALSVSKDAVASGIFAQNASNDDNIFLGGKGYLAPSTSPDMAGNGRFLGLVAVWLGTAQYTQPVTLPAGCYNLTFPTYNGGGTGAVASNLFGFIADNGTQYTCDETSWVDNKEWKDMSVTFILEEETSGVISLGYASANAGSGSMPHLFIDGIKITEGNPNVVLRPQIEAAKKDLIALLQDGDELGADTRDGWSVYNDDNASLEQVQQAIAKQKENNAKGMTDLTDFFINNAHFAEGNPVDGGISTYDYDMPVNGSSRFGMQPVDKWIASSPSDNVQRMENNSSRPENPLNSRASGLFAVGSGGNVWLGSVGDVAPSTKANGATEGNVFGFISVWSGTAYYSQHVTLPAGNYTITIPTYNERGTGAIAKNMCGFIADNGQEYLAKSTTFPVSQWTNETIKFTLDEETPGVITIGYVAANAGSGSMPHLFVDEFLLRYNGVLDVSPSLLALQGAVRTAESYTDDDLIYEAALKNTLKADVEKGKDLVAAGSTDDDVNVKTATDINNGIVNARSSMAAYEEFHAFLEDCSDFISTYDESSRVGIRLNNLLLTYEEGYNNRTYGNHEIRVIIDGFDAKVQEIIQEVMNNPIDPGTDVSDWLVNPSFADGFNGWTNSQGSTPIGNVGGLTFCPDVEVYENIVDIQQIVTNAPDGIYSLECQAFERPASNGYFTGEEESNVFLYLNEFQTPVQHIVKDAMPGDKASDLENCYIGNGSGSWPYDYYVEGYGWIPNSVDGASYAFAATPKRYVQKAYGLVEGGQMKVGLTSNGRRAHWVLWANFKLTFEGKTVKSLTALLNTSMQKCEDIRDRHQFSWPVDEKLSDAYDKAEGALYSNDVNYMWDALIALNGQINEAQKNATLLQDFQNELDSNDMYQIGDMIEEMDDSDLLDEYNEFFNIDPYDCTNEEIQNTIGYIRDFISRVRYAYNVYLAEQRYEYILAAVDGASDANPVDITWEALVNPDLEEGNANGWTLDLQTYTNKGYQGMSYYGDLTEVDDEEYVPFCANFIEVWCSDYNNPILGDIYQTVKLPAGTYRLGADMIASYQGGSDPVHGCYLVANDTHLEAGTANGVPQHFELYFKLTKPTVVKLGINCTSSTNANWLAADNFTLTAYGTNSGKDANGEKIEEGKTLQLDLAEGWNWVSVNKYDWNNANVFNDFLYANPEMNYVASQTQNIIWDEFQSGWFGDLQSIAPGLGYKMKLSGDVEVELTGDNCSARYTNIMLNQGWNWIGYTPVKAQKPNVAMAQFYPEEGDMVKAKDGFIIFQNGAWTENITMQPGQGYLYYSNANYSKNVKFDDQEQQDNSSRHAIRGMRSESLFDIDVHRYANNMAIIALVDAQNADDLEVYAFAGEECRGKSVQAAGLQLVTVQGDKNGEEIHFIIYNKVSGEMFHANESVKYNGSKMGTANNPVMLTLGQATGIAGIAAAQQADTYNIQGIKVGKTSQKGIYIKGGNKVVIK